MRTMRFPLLFLLLVAAAACSRDLAPASDATPDEDEDTAEVAVEPTVPPAPPSPEVPARDQRIDDLVRADDTLETLRARLGAGAIVAETLPGAEGETAQGWTLFPDDPSRRLAVYLDHRGEHPLLLVAGREATAWTRADGVRIGLSSQALARLNRGAFGFMGFDWDYGGVVTDWRGGRLAPDGASAGPVRLCPPPPHGDAAPDHPVGDQEYGSDDARLLTNPAVVCEFGVNVDPPAPDGG